MQVVALGVETRKQLEVLQELGCHTCQGALFYPPLPAAGLLEQAGGDFNTQTLPSNEDISHE
jgi:EAL domain-containing protein (putative c-di-GMP-specific phosphodiesterase class I)